MSPNKKNSSGIKLVSVSWNYTVDENFQISLSFHVVSFSLGFDKDLDLVLIILMETLKVQVFRY